MGGIRLCALLTCLASPAWAEPEPVSWERFVEARRARCVGEAATLDAPRTITAGGRRYEVLGHRLRQLDQDKDQRISLGVVSALKDDREATLAALAEILARFAARKVDLVVANGDLATNEFELEKVFAALGQASAPVLLLIGNTESCGSFNRTALEAAQVHPGLINGNWIRRLELDDATLLTLPGYYDRRFTHTGGASTYKPEDLVALDTLGRGAPGPLVLVSHGPPRMAHKGGLDVVTDGSHVGDPGMSELLGDLKISFGIFGHILEAGGRGSRLDGRPLPQKVWQRELYVNAGSLNPDPWAMLDGKTSYGMALWVEIDRGKARYEVLRPSPVKSPGE